jgi:pSer/pThr/pTyr-binding forkhead associated (FHA) protein
VHLRSNDEQRERSDDDANEEQLHGASMLRAPARLSSFTLLHTRTSRRHNHVVAVRRPSGEACLELEAGPALRGTLFALRVDDGEVHIGSTAKADIALSVGGLSAHHARLFRVDGAWFVQDVNPRSGTWVNGAMLGKDARALADGDRISLDRDVVVLRFHAARPTLSGITSYGATSTRAPWVTFCEWSTQPKLSYAMSDDGVVVSARHVDRRGAGGDGDAGGAVRSFTSRTFDALGERAHLADGCVVFDDDIAGVRWADLLWRTSEQRASLDGRLLLAAASLMTRGGDLRHSRMHVAWSGAMTWHARPTPPRRSTVTPQAAALAARDSGRPMLLAHLVAIAAGCTRLPRGALTAEEMDQEEATVLLDHKKAMATLALDSDVRAALVRVLDAALDAPHSKRALEQAIVRERMAVGAPALDDVAGLVAHLFVEERARHQRIVEEAQMLGVDGILR